jgi:hypothetical protein
MEELSAAKFRHERPEVPKSHLSSLMLSAGIEHSSTTLNIHALRC